MNHDTLNILVKFICSARKVAGPIEANRLVKDMEYRNEIFSKIVSECDEKLYEMLVELRDKLELNETISSSNAYKNAGVNFNYYYNRAAS